MFYLIYPSLFYRGKESCNQAIFTETSDFVPSTGGFSSVSFKSAMSIVTLRAVLVGWVVGTIVAAMNVRFDSVVNELFI